METARPNYFITSPQQILCLGALGIIGNLAAFILPVIVGGIVDHLGLNVKQAGYVATAEMLGLGLGALLFSRFILQANWRYFALCAVVFVASANVISPFCDTVYTLLPIRFLAGIGGGMLLSVGNSGMASTKSPERVLGCCGVAAMLFAAAALYTFPQLVQSGGVKYMFFTIATLNLLLGFFIMGIPQRSPYAVAQGAVIPESSTPESLTPETSTPKTSGKETASITEPSAAEEVNPAITTASTQTGWLGLLGILFFFMAAMAFWAYFERVGVAQAYSVDAIASVLGTSQLFGALGAITPVLLATKLGNRKFPIYAAILLAALSALFIATGTALHLYTFAACAFIYSWAVFYPYLMAVMISLDPSAKLVTYALGIQTLGKSLGPAIATFLIIGDDFSRVYWFCLLLFIAAFAALTPAIRQTDKKLKQNVEQPTG